MIIQAHINEYFCIKIIFQITLNIVIKIFILSKIHCFFAHMNIYIKSNEIALKSKTAKTIKNASLEE